MKISVLVNNYNYGRFLPEALASAAAQTLPAHEIIVVDDGSTDDSLAVLESLRAKIPGLRVIAQANGGQLSAMRTGIRAASGDWCASLDSDDAWKPNHLAAAAAVIATQTDVSAYYSEHETKPAGRVYHGKWPAGVIGPLPHLVSATGCRVGSITSPLLMERGLALSVTETPPELDADWRTRADDCLLFGAAFAGARFWFNPEVTVEYRLHSTNAYAGRDRSAAEAQTYLGRRERLFAHYRSRFGLPESSSPADLATEARRPENRGQAVLRRRCRRAILRARAPISARLQAWLASWF
jgi:glycosyltransferase involved in cell wall biosynthesis